jgi:glycoprotein 6-alpha-L-fucosyltransferase
MKCNSLAQTTLIQDKTTLILGYTFIGNQSTSDNANYSIRYSKASLVEFLIDLHVLVKSDYLVCTYSSNIGRLAYEMRHQMFADAEDRTRSVDSIWFYSMQDNHQQVSTG